MNEIYHYTGIIVFILIAMIGVLTLIYYIINDGMYWIAKKIETPQVLFDFFRYRKLFHQWRIETFEKYENCSRDDASRIELLMRLQRVLKIEGVLDFEESEMETRAEKLIGIIRKKK